MSRRTDLTPEYGDFSVFHSAATLNIPATRGVLDYLRAHPEEHNQDYFGFRSACGTTMCIAGTACFLDEDTVTRWEHPNQAVTYFRDDVTVGESALSVEDRAREILGLKTGDDVERLFYDFDNARVLDKLAAWIEAAELEQSKTSRAPGLNWRGAVGNHIAMGTRGMYSIQAVNGTHVLQGIGHDERPLPDFGLLGEVHPDLESAMQRAEEYDAA